MYNTHARFYESVALQEDIDAEVVTPREFMINKL